MENIEMTMEGDILVIKVDMTKDFGLTKSEKSRKIASTGGNAKIPGTDAMIGLNVYRKV